MRERASLAGSWLRLESRVGEGTLVEARIPHSVDEAAAMSGVGV